jgi:serine/threonine-protein kinase
LRDRIDHQKQLPLEVACNIARDVADALAYAHAQGVIHRDIKPENILLSAGHPVLADFGIARAIDLAGVRQLTRTGKGSPGTPAYMSPEQMMGDGTLDGRSDTYSLGCVLFEMLTGKPPFAGREGFAKRFTEDPPRPSSLKQSLPPWMDDVVTRALARSPIDRFQTAQEFVMALTAGGKASAESLSADGRRVMQSAPSTQSHASGPKKYDSEEVRIALLARKAGAGKSVSFTESITRPSWVAQMRKHRVAAIAGGVGILVIVVVAAARDDIPSLRNSFFGSKVDSTRVALVPFAGNASQRDRDRIANGLYATLSEWQGLQLASSEDVADATKTEGPPTSTRAAAELARRVGAGRFIWGQVSSDDPAEARAQLYDVSSDVAVKSIRFPQSSDRAAIDRVARELLEVPNRPPAADGGDGATRSYPAWRAYGLGHVALGQWDLPGAEQQFSVAVAADPTFAVAQLWLAQIGALRNSYSPVEAWSEQVALALSTRRGLHQRDSSLAVALNSMASGDYGNACKSYRQLVDTDARDYFAWYGLGFCGGADRALVRDSRHPEVWNFRSSYLRAAQAFDKATQLEPRLFAVLPFSTLLDIAPIRAGQLRTGVVSDKSKEVFLAYPSIIADTLAYTPFPLADIQGGRLRTTPKTAGLAAQQSRTFLLRVVLRWIRQFPASADAQEALSILQESGGEVGADRDGVPSALTAVLNAQKLTLDKEKRAQLILREVRLRLKRDEFERARALSDSVLATSSTISAPSGNVAGLAALTGRLSSAQQLLPPASILVGSFETKPALPNEAIMNAAGALFVRAALGACSEDFDRIAAQLNGLFESYLPSRQQAGLRQALTQRSWSMATPCRPAYALRVTAPVDRLLRMQQALARSQMKEVRAEFDSLEKLRENDRPGDVSPDVMYQEAWLLTAIGDTAAAIRKLDRSLNALPTWGGFMLDVPQAAGLVRAMILRADLAQTRGDLATSQKWARAASTLWANADLTLQPEVRRMRSIAQLRASSADPNQSQRR